MKRVILLLLIMVISGCQKDTGKRVLLIGIDGLQYEQMQKVPTPNLDRFTMTKAYAGGVVGTDSEQPTVSGPGWATLLTGVWAYKHQVWSNALYTASPEHPSFMWRIKQNVPSLSLSAIMNWVVPYFVFFLNEAPILNHLSMGDDESVTNQTIERLISNKSDVIFMHLDDPDHAGHAYGFSTHYENAIFETDQRVGLLLDTINQRSTNFPNEDWLIMVVTDHGREPGSGMGHGNQSLQEKTAFIGVISEHVNEAINLELSGILDTSFDGLYGYPSQADVVPTILTHLQVPIKSEWLLDGTSLIGKLGVYRLMVSQNKDNGYVRLQWLNGQKKSHSDVASIINIYRNEKLIATLPSSSTEYIDSDIGKLVPSDSTYDYRVNRNGKEAHIRLFW